MELLIKKNVEVLLMLCELIAISITLLRECYEIWLVKTSLKSISSILNHARRIHQICRYTN